MFGTDKKIQLKEFPVNKDFGEEEGFFRLITEGGEVQLPKLEFQKSQPLPDTLRCRVKGYNGNLPILGHDMPGYVSEFYADGFSRGEEFEFRVKALPQDDKGYYRLEDDNGLQFKLREHKSALSYGQSVKCRFEILEPTVYSLRRSVTDAQLQMVTLRDVARVSGFRDVPLQKIFGALGSLPEMAKALDDLGHNRASWVLEALRAARTALPRWFKESIDSYPHDRLKAVLCGYKYVTMYLLQGSGFLRNIKGNERNSLQAEFTGQIEQADIYIRALDIIARGRQDRFIKDLLENLKESGYIYHPNEQFAIMMILFQLSPELVNTSLGNIFDTLMGWDLETWKSEPFRQAFVEQLEIYIRETMNDIDRFMQPETANDNEKIEKVLTSIAIQQSLYIPSDRISMLQNMSLFYRYLSLLRSAKADVLLQKSYLTLLGVKLPVDFTWSDIKEPTMMMTRAAVDPPATAVLPESCRYFLTPELEVQVGPEGIAIGRLFEDAPPAVPNGMLKWPGLQVNVSMLHSMNRQKMKSIEGHDEFWTDVESALFLPPETGKEQTSTQRYADIDDVVRIEIDRVLTQIYDTNRIEGFHCKVVDDHFLDSEGYLRPENLVNYNLHGVTIGVFRHDDGSPMQFDARVIGIDDNDRPIFSLLETTHNAMRDLANTGERYYCVITRDNGRSYSAIADAGFGLYINKFKDGTPPFHPGNVVVATITGYDNEAVQAVIEDGPIDNYEFKNARALRNILKNVAVYRDDDLDEDMQLEEEESISHDEIREIVQILRYKAVSLSGNIIEAFDYLSYARLLALVIGDEKLAMQIRAHKEILLLYQHYAKNKQVFADDIERVAVMAPESVLVERMAHRLRIVSALGRGEENSALWDIVNKSDNELEKQLAEAVLSYNFLCDNGGDSITSSIKDRIAGLLNVDSEQRHLKYYGSESQYVEFKSSMVYPARKGRSGLSVADPDKQEHEILHIIAGFMNSTGGVLYIGVSDDHYERGLNEDLTFYRMDNTDRNTKFRRSIKSLDNLANYLQNLIDSSFNIGKNAGDYAKAFIDDESLKGVILVKVDPCPHIVKLDGVIYVRHSAKTEPLTKKDEIEMFVTDRERLYQQQLNANVATETPAEAIQQNPTEDSAEKETEIPDAESIATVDYGVMTSSIRNNVIHEYQDAERFLPAVFYIRFVDDHNFVLTTDEWSIDDTERLVLNVHDDEADGLLLLLFEGELAVKVPLRDLQQKSLNTVLPHYGDRRLVFASVVKPGDGLYTLHANSKGTLYERVTPVDKIFQGTSTSVPERILEAECVSTPLSDIIPASRLSEFSALLSTGMKRNVLGAMAKGVGTARTTAEEIRKSLASRLAQ